MDDSQTDYDDQYSYSDDDGSDEDSENECAEESYTYKVCEEM